jgi:hypothetical protein
MQSWSPPEPDLGFEIVRSARVAQTRRWWQISPAWGLAAAAMLTLAVASAIANVEVRAGSGGIVVSTGWSRGAAESQATAQTVAAPATAEYAAKLEAVTARLQELEQRLAAQPAVVNATAATAPDRDEVLRVARQLITESEQRQETLLATKMLQLSRDTEVQRRSDVDRFLIAMRQLQGTSYETSQRLDHLIRTGFQR